MENVNTQNQTSPEQTENNAEELGKGIAVEDNATEQADTASETASTPEKAEKHDRSDKKRIKELEKQLSELQGQLEAKEAELLQTNDKYLRIMAEYDNFRKRSAKEKDGIYADAYADALKSILPIIDSLEKASGYKDAESVAKGVEMILSGARDALSKMGVESFGEKGEQFDPNRHNAIMHVEDESLGENVISDVYQKGYIKGDKVLRYAMVTVAN